MIFFFFFVIKKKKSDELQPRPLFTFACSAIASPDRFFIAAARGACVMRSTRFIALCSCAGCAIFAQLTIFGQLPSCPLPPPQKKKKDPSRPSDTQISLTSQRPRTNTPPQTVNKTRCCVVFENNREALLGCASRVVISNSRAVVYLACLWGRSCLCLGERSVALLVLAPSESRSKERDVNEPDTPSSKNAPSVSELFTTSECTKNRRNACMMSQL